MGFATQGTEVREISSKTGPQGRALLGDGERGLGSHTEANRSVKARAAHPAGSAVGFQDTPAVTAAFEKLEAARHEREAAEEQARQASADAAEDAARKTREAAAAGLDAKSKNVAAAGRQLDVAKARQELDRAEAAAGGSPDPGAAATATTTTGKKLRADAGKPPKEAS